MASRETNMTPDQTQGSRLVAEAMGYTIRQVCELWHIWLPGVDSRFAENSSRDNGGPRYTLEDLMAAHFPLFAPASHGGASAREEARKWLLTKRYIFTTWTIEDGSFISMFKLNGVGVPQEGATQEE